MKLKIGDTVIGKFGSAKIKKIELCEMLEKNMGSYSIVWGNLVDKCVFDMTMDILNMERFGLYTILGA